MTKRRILDRERHAHFVTFSCYRRRRLLDDDRAKRSMLGTLNAQLRRLAGRCVGFVLMPAHVHAIVWFAEEGQLSEFMKQWKRTSSLRIRQLLSSTLVAYANKLDVSPVWQAKYYGFNLYSRRKMEEKLKVHAPESGACWAWFAKRANGDGVRPGTTNSACPLA